MICIHTALVCIICNRFIISIETIQGITKKRILNNKHRLSVEKYELFHGDINPIVVGQYTVDGLEGMLLSPRSFSCNEESMSVVHNVFLA